MFDNDRTTREGTSSGTAATTRTRFGALAASSAMAVVLVSAIGSAAPAYADLRNFTSAAVSADGGGYLIVSDRGEKYAFGTMSASANPSGFSGSIVDVAATADGRGSLALSSSGQFYATGTARAWPNPTGFSGSMAAVAITADGQGALAMSTAGQFYAYGTAKAQPNPSGFSGRMVDVSLTGDGQGALAVSSVGQFYAYGTAAAQPNPTGFSGEIRGVDITNDGRGALAVSSAGQFYAYGSARAWANPTGFTGSVVDVDMTADGQGAMAVSSTGQAYHYGTVVARGNADPGTVSSLGARVADLTNRHYFSETGANDCNPYSYAVGSGSFTGTNGATCPAGQRAEAWCADFAKTIWSRSGARTTGITPAARSFSQVAGFRSGSTNTPRVGDAIVWPNHVGIVVEVVNSTWIKVRSGNYSNAIGSKWIDPRSEKANGGYVMGYTTPTPV